MSLFYDKFNNDDSYIRSEVNNGIHLIKSKLEDNTNHIIQNLDLTISELRRELHYTRTFMFDLFCLVISMLIVVLKFVLN